MKKIVLMSLVIVLAGVAISGGTFAYFSASTSASNNVIHESSYTLNANLAITAIRSGNLVPTADNLIMTSLNGSYPCEDNRGYSLCSLYRANLTNSSYALELNGYVRTNSGTTFTTSDLKYMLLTKSGNTYTAASDINTINVAVSSKNYFKSSNNNISFPLSANGSLEYYLVIWLSDDGSNQLDTVNKIYNGSFVFEAPGSGEVAADFGGVAPSVAPNVDRDTNNDQIEVKITSLRVRVDAGTDKDTIGYASKGFYNYYDTKEANGYTWYKIANNQWIASGTDWTTVYPALE